MDYCLVRKPHIHVTVDLKRPAIKKERAKPMDTGQQAIHPFVEVSQSIVVCSRTGSPFPPRKL